MDDFVLSNLQESRNEWCSRLVSIFTPLILGGVKSLFNESWKLCIDNDEPNKYLMTFQNLLSRIPKWNNEIIEDASSMLGRKLVTHQTGAEGKGIYRLYVEAGVPIDREIYLGFVLDRTTQRIMIVASSEGGTEIEEISANKPDSIVRASIDPAVGLVEFQAREIAFKLGIEPTLTQYMVRTLMGCFNAFRDLDATMVEINPLVITTDKQVMALDAKMTFDDNALFRHPKISELRDKSQEDPRESNAADRGLSYVG
jgi:succinyl-CoA synthetase beta subunit/malate-CoA ligase subunit beta